MSRAGPRVAPRDDGFEAAVGEEPEPLARALVLEDHARAREYDPREPRRAIAEVERDRARWERRTAHDSPPRRAASHFSTVERGQNKDRVAPRRVGAGNLPALTHLHNVTSLIPYRRSRSRDLSHSAPLLAHFAISHLLKGDPRRTAASAARS